MTDTAARAILVIDDEDSVRCALSRALEAEGYEVLHAAGKHRIKFMVRSDGESQTNLAG